MEFLEFLTIPAITVICYLIGQLIKVTPLDSKYIPAICGVSGAVIGAIAFIINMPAMVDIANDIITAIAVGGASGLAATGIHQLVKQLSENKISEGFEDGDLE